MLMGMYSSKVALKIQRTLFPTLMKYVTANVATAIYVVGPVYATLIISTARFIPRSALALLRLLLYVACTTLVASYITLYVSHGLMMVWPWPCHVYDTHSDWFRPHTCGQKVM